MNNIVPSIKYFLTAIKHKYFVFIAGLEVDCSIWRLIKHDWTKFLPCELPHYGRQFFGDKNDSYGFNKAWLHHQNFNDHHWEFWIPRTIIENNKVNNTQMMLMSDGAIKEMVADWLGASRAYEGKWPKNVKEWSWLNKNFNNLPLLRDIRSSILFILQSYFYKKTREYIEWDENYKIG